MVACSRQSVTENCCQEITKPILASNSTLPNRFNRSWLCDISSNSTDVGSMVTEIGTKETGREGEKE